MRRSDRRSVSGHSVMASRKQQVESPRQEPASPGLATPAAPSCLSHCTSVAPGVLICPATPRGDVPRQVRPAWGSWTGCDGQRWGPPGMVSGRQSRRRGRAKSDLEQRARVCVRWGGGHRQNWPDLTLFRQALGVQAAKNCPPRSRYVGAGGGGGRRALSGWLCQHLTQTRNSSLLPPGTWPCF